MFQSGEVRRMVGKYIVYGKGGRVKRFRTAIFAKRFAQKKANKIGKFVTIDKEINKKIKVKGKMYPSYLKQYDSIEPKKKRR